MRTLMPVRRAFPLMLLVTASFVSSWGCSRNPDNVVSVTGAVTHNGNPVPGLVVSFVPQKESYSGPSTATTDDSGQYKLTVSKTGQSGAVVGTHKVWVSLPRTPPDSFNGEKVKKKPVPTNKPPVDTAAILKKYGNLEKTPLTVEVKGEPIDLKLD
jgi:hypothetical protein